MTRPRKSSSGHAPARAHYDLMNIKTYMRLSLPDLAKLDKYVDQPENG